MLWDMCKMVADLWLMQATAFVVLAAACLGCRAVGKFALRCGHIRTAVTAVWPNSHFGGSKGAGCKRGGMQG